METDKKDCECCISRAVEPSVILAERIEFLSRRIEEAALGSVCQKCSVEKKADLPSRGRESIFNCANRHASRQPPKHSRLRLGGAAPGLRIAFALEVKCYGFADQLFQRRFIDLVAFVDVDSAPDISLKAGIE